MDHRAFLPRQHYQLIVLCNQLCSICLLGGEDDGNGTIRIEILEISPIRQHCLQRIDDWWWFGRRYFYVVGPIHGSVAYSNV